MLSLIVGDAPVGIYSAAYSLSNPLTLIPSAILISLFPIMSESFQTSEERLVKIYKLSFKYILIIMLPIAVGTTIIADKIIPLVYTAKYISSITPLQILIWALLLASINAIMVNLLVSSNNQRLSTISVTLGALINIPLNLVLIPIWSYNGAAIATVITKVMILGANIYFISKYLQFSPPLSISTKPLSCAFLMGLFLCGVKNFNIILVIFSAILVYFATLLIMRTFSDEDINIFKRALYFFKRS
jgi:O-antigen/teichoic acid export membrane protein